MIDAHGLTVSYGDRTVLSGLDLSIEPGGFTVIIGPNGCGKSTLLGALARAVPSAGGSIVLDGKQLASYRAKELARHLGLLPQSPTAPDGITVAELVARGRYPHRSLVSGWNEQDEAAVTTALARTGVTELADRFVDELSGGQRQRVWIALVLAQETPLLLLDEPTSALDLAHQIEVLRLCRTLNEQGSTIVAVLHDLNQAFRYASDLVVMKDGRIVARGTPGEVVTAELVRDVFGIEAVIETDSQAGSPLVTPLWGDEG
ncbi:ABC transporter ATP-binding protein [Leucobacter chinensis]|uniref:ABC transporter ATP-binding protein n=1 Tax=Leucobacter chinensis TaxID=2851010 RepID=UPI001C231788|nr:ABC transporter ATP-binding protein [Leucobacter chinensis]